MERDGEWELERLLRKWGNSGHPRLRGYTQIKIGLMMDNSRDKNSNAHKM